MGDITVTDSAHPSHLVEELVALRSAGELFDYVIKGNKESFHFHSLVLALVSPVFRAMLRSEMGESTKKEAIFPSIPDNIMAKTIDYAYNGTCSFSRAHLMDLVKAAHYLQMSKLLRMCEEQISTVLRPTNCISWLQLADKLHLTAIMPKVQKMMQTSYKEIITTTDFKQLEKPELLRYMINLREHGTYSDDLMNGTLQWINHDTQNRSEHLEDLLTMVQISKCSDYVLSKMMDDNEDLFNKQQNIHKLVMSEVLSRLKPKLLGDVKTIIIGGGQFASATPNNACWILQNGEIVKFSEMDTDITVTRGCSVCQIPGGMMLTGGLDSDLCVIFVLSMKMWVKQQSLLATRTDHASCFSNGKVFLIGGKVSYVKSGSVDIMDLEKKTWCTGPPLPQESILLKVTDLKSTLFVLFSDKCSLYEFDEDKTSWLTKASLPSPSNGCSIAASDDNIFAVGGDENINYMYTPATDAWCCLTGPSLRERLGALVYNQQKLYLFPGCKWDNNLTDVEEYDISADKWSPAKWKMPKPMYKFSAFLVDIPK